MDSGDIFDKSAFHNDLELRECLNKTVSEDVAGLSELEPDISFAFKNKSSRNGDLVKDFFRIEAQVDECEQIVGKWVPTFKYPNMFGAVD